MKIVVEDENGETHDLVCDPGQSVMQVLRNQGLNITAQCGGEASCGTCHVYVSEIWADRLPKPDEVEAGMLDFVDEPLPTSRLSCQIVLDDTLDGLTLTIAPGSAF